MSFSVSSEIVTLPAGHPAILIDNDDAMHEIHWTEWTEFDDLKYGPDWRFAMFSVVRQDGQVEFALIRHYENDMKDVLIHMKCPKDVFPSMVEKAQGIVKAGSPKDPEPFAMVLKKGEWKDY